MLMSETVQNTINPRPHLSPQKEAICGHELRPKGIESRDFPLKASECDLVRFPELHSF